MMRTIAYASCYVYSPAGIGELCERSRLLRTMLKAGDATFMLKYACRVRQQAQDSPQLAGFFSARDVLVPVPGSAPHIASGDAWAAERLAAALLDAGLGGSAWSGLRRVRPVPKSATAARGTRPTVSVHYESFDVDRPPAAPQSIVLIDDVVTKGRTLLAAASRVRDAFPESDIRAFALVRTMGFAEGVRQLIDPCLGVIRWRAGDAYRNP